MSTVNNYRSNFVPGANLTLEWNPDGTGEFRFYNMRVTSVTYRDGSSSDVDPIVGLPLMNSDVFTAGKLVDLDVDVQLEKGEIWGQYVGLNWAKPQAKQHNSFMGYMQPTNLAHDVWRRAICVPKSTEQNINHNMSSVAKSILRNVTWAEDIDSQLLQELKDETQAGYLSIRMVVYFMVRDFNPNNFTFGDVHGTIGPAFLDEPTQFTGHRKLHYEEVNQPPASFFKNIKQCQGQDVKAWIYNVPFRLIQVLTPGRLLEESVKLTADFGNAVTMDMYFFMDTH